MRSRMFGTLMLLFLCCAVWIVGCEDSGVLAPTDSEISVSASPGTVIIDEAAGETEGQSQISAYLFDAEGFPLEGVQVSFSTTGGTLDSAPAGQDPLTVETNANGLARDTLTLVLADDSTVTVTARSGQLTGTVDVGKTVSSGNVEPEAFISADPDGQQRKTLPVNFSGVASDDPDGEITCWKWTITSDIPANSLVAQGPSRSSFVDAYADEQTLSVLLEVSDDPDPASFCTFCEGSAATCGADNVYFSPFSDSIQYEIVCDLTDPFASGGPDRTVALSGGTVTVNLSGATSSDNESVSYTHLTLPTN